MSADERVGTAVRERLAADLAVRGGRLALEYFHRAQVSWKPDGSMVTDADIAIQEHLATEIARAFPDDAVVGEEGQPEHGRSEALYSWVLDPVDGTNNFGRGLPGFAVSIGVLRNRQPFAGAVYDPITRWLFTACAGRGAWLNERPLRTRPAPLSRSSLFVDPDVRWRTASRRSSRSGCGGTGCAGSARPRCTCATSPSARSTSCTITAPRCGTSPAQPRCCWRRAVS